MKPTRRRSFLQIILASIGSTVAGSRRASGQSHAQTTASLDASPRAKAIRALRVVNSLQNWHFNDRGQFIPLEELMRDDLAQRFVANMRMPPFTPANVARTGQLLEGFVTSFQLAPDRTSYVIFLREKSSTKTFTTDSRGVIKEGAIDVPLDRFANVPSTSLTAAFRGAPIVPPERPRAKRPTILGIVASFFVPILNAQPGSSCCGACGGHCISAKECSQCFPNVCCNLGYSICTYCCIQGQTVCDCVDEC